MHILINARFLAAPYTGIGQHLKGVVYGFVEVGHHVTLCTHTQDIPQWVEEVGVRVVVTPEWNLPGKGLRKSVWEYVHFPKVVRKEQPDVVYVPYPSLSQIKTIPTVHVVHDVIPWVESSYRRGVFSWLYHQATKRAMKKAKYVVTISAFSEEEIRKVLKKAAHIPVVYNGSPFEFYEEPSAKNVKEIQNVFTLYRPYVVYVGGYDLRKHVPELVNSFRQWGATHGVDLVLVGKSLFQNGLYRMPGVEEEATVHAIGTITDSELFALMKGARGLVHGTQYEGFNVPIVQAFQAHIPVLAPPIPVHEELFAGAYIPLPLFDEMNAKEAWKIFLTDEEQRKNCVNQGIKYTSTYSWKATATRLCEYFQQIINKKN